jgi:hypothetical protein
MRTIIGKYPSIFYPMYGLRPGNRANFVCPRTEVVIEGFPRSANSFVVAVFRHMHSRQPSMAHHVHAPAQVLRGVCMNIPTLVLIRRPLDAVTSLLVFTPRIPVSSALRAYHSFYTTVFPYRAGFVAATFEEAIEHLDQVVERLNQRFSTDFVVPKLSTEDRDSIFQAIDGTNSRAYGNLAERTGRPSSDRDLAKRAARSRIQHPRYQALLGAADRVYHEFVKSTCCVTGPDRLDGAVGESSEKESNPQCAS